ncbi:unnamed protein product [Cuscuta europaea]|uniref:Transmembrane protein n=1 Tax=Cuscuta europaea TaxID=41803 RepID=A0A9P1EDA6_CUSEU|nr:unnamed protein product [Cuscuta europaea]
MEQLKVSKSSEQNATSQNTFLVFKVEARACYLCLLIGQSSRREDLVRASSNSVFKHLTMLMDIVFHYGACVLMFAPCGICFQTMFSAAYSITYYVCLWMTYV